MKPTAKIRHFLRIASSALLTLTGASAATYYWDGNSNTAGFAAASGSWLAPTPGPTPGWSTNNAGTAVPASVTTATADTLNFGNGSTGLAAGTITAGTVSSGNMTFASGSGAIVLSAGTITLAAAQTTTVDNAGNTIDAVLAGAATSFTKAGNGSLLLTGANTFAGSTIVNGGTLDLGGGGATGSLASTVLTLGGGAFQFTRNDNATHSFLTTNINSRSSAISVSAGNILNLGTVARGTGGAFDFSSTGAGILSALATSNVTGIMPGLTHGDSWAVANGDGVSISALGSYTLTSAAATTGSNYTSNNIDVDNSAGMLDAAITANSVRFSAAAANTLALAAGTNTISSSGILVGSAVGGNLSTISGGTLTGAVSKDLSIIQKNASGGLTISSVIANNTSTSVTKSGAGLLTLSGNNTFTGGLVIHAGSVVLADPGAINNTAGSQNAVTMSSSSARLVLNGNSVVVRSLDSSVGAAVVENAHATPSTLTIGNSGNANSTFAGLLQDGTGGGALTLTKAGTGTLTLSNNSNSYSGGTSIGAGTVFVTANGQLAAGAVTFTGSGKLNTGHSSYPTLANAVVINSGATATINEGNQFYKMTFTAPLSGSGNLLFSTGGGGAAGELNFTNSSNTFTGRVQVSMTGNGGGGLTVHSLADGANPVQLTGNANTAIFKLGGNGANASSLLFNSRQIELNGTLAGGGTLENNNSDINRTITVNTGLLVSATGNKTLTLGGSNTGNNSFNGVIPNGPSGAVSVAKTGGGKWLLGNAASTYSGVTTVSAGTLEVTKLDIGGNNSSIGASTNAAANLVFNSGGILRYTGPGDGTDRAFTYNSTANDTGWTINSSGTGALNFTSTGTITYTGTAGQNRYFTLTGTNADDNSFAATITNNGAGVVNVTKGGTGKWILTGANTYTGGTFIQSGILEVQSGAGNLTQTLGNLVTNTGEGTLVANKAGAGTLTINFSGRGRNAGGSVNMVSTGGTNGTDNSIVIIGAAGFIDKGTFFGGADFAARNGTDGYVRALAYGTDTDAEPVDTITSAKHVKLATTPGIQSAIALLSLNLAGSGVSWTTSSGNLNVPGIIKSGGGSQGTISGGSLTTTSNAELVVRADTLSDSLLISAPLTIGTGVLTKSGAGSLTLGGTNTYTGATNVNAGKLFITGTNANNSATTVKSGATLGGTGTLGGSVTVQADAKLEFNLGTAPGSHDKLDLAASRTLTFSGASVLTITSSGGATTGAYTLLTAPGGIVLTNNVLPTVNLPGGWTGSVSIAGNDLVLNVTSVGGGGPGPVDHFDISAIASPQVVGAPITGITLTARDSSNAVATGFTGTVTFGGSGGFSGTSGTFTAGVLNSVSITPTIAGSNLTFTVDDGAGHTGSTTITTIQTPYDAWAGGVLFDADANGDGVKNGLAFLLGAAGPNSAVNLPVVSQSGGNLVMTFNMRNSTARGNASLKVQHSSNLGISDPWEAALIPDVDQTVNDIVFDISPGTPLNGVQATIPSSKAAVGKLFGRLEASQP